MTDSDYLMTTGYNDFASLREVQVREVQVEVSINDVWRAANSSSVYPNGPTGSYTAPPGGIKRKDFVIGIGLSIVLTILVALWSLVGFELLASRS